eukprot:SAG11_NODE_4721_length_1793_cov_1.502952_1_plen_123_part_10
MNPDRTEACEFLRIKNRGDFVRLELRAALDLKKLTIPLYTAAFDINKMIWQSDLPPDVAGIGRVNFVPLSMDYFDASIDKAHRFIETEAVAGKLKDLVEYDGELSQEPADATPEPELEPAPEP